MQVAFVIVEASQCSRVVYLAINDTLAWVVFLTVPLSLMIWLRPT